MRERPNVPGRLAVKRFMDRRVPRGDTGTPQKAVWVYVIQCGESCKIGIASDVRSRISNLSSGTPHALELLMCRRLPSIHYARIAERLAHKTLAAYHIKGEWFGAPPAMAKATVSVIAAMTRALHFRHWGNQPRWRIGQLVGSNHDRKMPRPLCGA